MKKLIILLSILALNDNKNKIYCDIKGNVNNPGVYEIKDNYTIQNIIKDAGGLKKNSYTENINLSKKVTDEMVIYIFNKNEIKKQEELNNCICIPVYKYVDCPKEENKIITTTVTTTKIPETTKKSKEEITTTTTTQITTMPKTTKRSTTKRTTKVPTTTQQVTTTPVKENKLININTATVEELQTLKGLGEKKALAIIEYRKNYGPFEIIEDIMKVSGIGKSTYEKIKEYIEV